MVKKKELQNSTISNYGSIIKKRKGTVKMIFEYLESFYELQRANRHIKLINFLKF